MQGPDGSIALRDFVDVPTFDTYLQSMNKDGEYADHVVVLAMAQMLKTDIVIVTSSPGAGPEESIIWVQGIPHFNGDPLLLGHYWEHHYQSLRPLDMYDEMGACHIPRCSATF